MPEQSLPKKRKGGRKPYKPTTAQRRDVAAWASIGAAHEVMALQLGISRPTLEKAFAKELSHGKTLTDQAISKTLYQKALSGDNACLIFWAKTRLGWRETNRTELTGPDGAAIQVQSLSDAELRAQLQAILDASAGQGEAK